MECLTRAQQSGDTDYSHMLSVTHVSVGENGGGGGGGDGGKKRRTSCKRNSDYSIESTSVIDSERRRSSIMDTDTTAMDEYDSSSPNLRVSRTLSDGVASFVGNKRRDTSSQRISWTAGAPAVPMSNQQLNQSWTAGNNHVAATASSSRPSFQLNQSWTAGSNPLNSNPVPNTAASASSMPSFQLNHAWTAGSNPLSTSPIQLNQSWKATGFTPNNASQLSRIQFDQQLNQMMNRQLSNAVTSTNSTGDNYNGWKNMVLQSSRHSGGSSSGGDHQQQQAWGNGINTSQVAFAPQSSTNGNSYTGAYAQSHEQQQWSQFHQQQWSQFHQQQQQQQHQQGQLNGVQQDQQPQPQSHDVIHGQQEDQIEGGGGLTQEDIDLRMFFERFAEQFGEADDDK